MTCGACCTSRSARHVPVTGEDWGRLGDDADALTHWIENRAFMRVEAERCVALAVDGESVRCTIYARRPEICRALERGGPACAAERFLKTSALTRRTASR
jgi:hypothetical protein